MNDSMKGKRLVILGTLDTRGDEVAFVRTLLQARGHRVSTIDMGILGEPMAGEGDYPRQQVAEAGGSSLDELVAAARSGADRDAGTRIMIKGAKRIVAELAAQDKLDGVMGLGGSTAAAAGAAVMNGLPIGLPKILLTTFTRLAPIGEEDIVVMQTPTDLIGLNAIVSRALANAAGALAGMVEQTVPTASKKKLVGITALGVTTPAVQHVISRLESQGFDTAVFHATTEKLDRLIAGGVINAVIDLTTFESILKLCYSDEQLQAATGTTEVDRTRLTSAEQRGIPLVIAPGGLDIHILPGVQSKDMIPAPLQGRPSAKHGPDIMLVRTSAEEMKAVATDIARRLNQAPGRVAAVIPTAGFSDASREGTSLYAPHTDQVFIDLLRQQANSASALHILDCNINDAQFADAVIEVFNTVLKGDQNDAN
ncbi:Tm-1-like ATP-binding domain-containing protein [Parahaliea mediterranea]|uniref:Tm-1-like ATP-binding domain-containing protein n=1 Tax=Parahaliea mediterranea TaxID=651086 RepID=UPI0013001B33|nr:Tm-1-like ATP-binding domain-containing protein [Parahaliea mediterranea]